MFIGADRPGQPVATLAGRRVVLGYQGWLYSYNIPYADRVAAVRAVLAGRPQDPAVVRFAPDYAVVAAAEDPSWVVDRTALAALPLAYSNPTWSVYKLGPAAGPPGSSALAPPGE